MNEDDPPRGEQVAFSEAYELAERLRGRHEFKDSEIGRGFLVAALNCFRRELTDTQIAEVLYEAADDYTTRGYSDD